MASHGIPRVSETGPKTQEELDKERERIRSYKELVSNVEAKAKAGQHDQESINNMSKLLKQNPEYYTIWNHRRRALALQLANAAQKKSDTDDPTSDIAKILSTELLFLVPLMRNYPKCYWLWNHRAWLLQQASSRLPLPVAIKFWGQELELDSKMLQQDKRNFHGWGYRRTIIHELERLRGLEGASEQDASMARDEYEYTRKMIGQDLSNFSAWHARSNLILRMLKEGNADAGKRKTMLDEELDLIHEALIDPRDQSLWFYHQFLMTNFHPETAVNSIAPELLNEERKHYLGQEIEYVLEALDGAEDVKWVYLSLIQLAYNYRVLGSDWPASAPKSQIELWTQELKKLDPKRANRWQDWSKTIHAFAE